MKNIIALTHIIILRKFLFFILLVFSLVHVEAQPLPLRSFVIFSGTSSIVGSSITINGGLVGSNNLVQSNGTIVFNTDIHSGGTASFSNSNSVTGKITVANTSLLSGNVLTIGSNALLSGNIDVNGSISIGGGIVSGKVTHPAGTIYSGPVPGMGEVIGAPELPVLPSFPAVTVFPAAGAMNITNNQTISPGAYGDVTLGSNKTLKLNGPGVYVFNSIHFSGSSTKIIYDFNHTTTGNFYVYIHGDADFGKLNASTLNGGGAGRILTEIHGSGTTTSSAGDACVVANGSSGAGSKALGTFWVPFGGINIGAGTGSSLFTGAFYSGQSIMIQSGVTVDYAPFGTCPVANAGPDQAFCGTSTGALLAANSPGEGTGTWSIVSGPSLSLTQFSDINDSTATFTPDGGAGVYDLRWTIAEDLCGISTDDVAITFNQTPTTANAGPDQTGSSTCDQTTVTLAANTPAFGTGSWSIVSGTGGSFGDASSPTSTFSGVAGESYTLRWTISNDPCPASTDDVDITFNENPMDVSAGPDKALNYHSEATLTGTSSTASVSYNWYSDNGGVISTPTDQAQITVTTAGRYILTVSTTIGCTVNDTAEVTSRLTDVIGSELQSIYDSHNPAAPDTESPFFHITPEGYVTIDVIVRVGFYAYVLDLLQQTSPEDYGMINIVSNGESGIIITGDFPIPNLPKLNLLGEFIIFSRPHYFGVNNMGLVTTAGDTTIRTYLARDGYGIDGSGIKIGVISDSYATIPSGTTATLPLQPVPGPIPQTFNTNTAAQDTANGDLPGSPANINGYTTPVHVLLDYPVQRSDEGRAMLQTIHDVAPGAELYFRTGYFTAGDFAVGIKQLRDSGCNIIVDDITYITESFLKDGLIARTVDSVVNDGVSYFSAAGNFFDISYENDFVPMDADSIGFTGKKAHDFGGGDAFLHVRLAPGNHTIVLQWTDSIYSTGETSGTHNDLDIYLTQSMDSTGLVGYNRDNTFGDPVEFIPISIAGTDSVDYNILIINNTPGSNPARIKFIDFRRGIRFLEHNNGASTVVGQANAVGAMTVGAVRFDKAPPAVSPPLPEPFTSKGGTQTNGTVRQKPDFMAADGGNTTVRLGQDYPNSALDGYSNFFGTSAAAPLAAAAAALVMEGKDKFLAQSFVPPSEIRSLFQSTAIDMEIAHNLPGTQFDYYSGYGLINIDLSMRTFAAPRPHLLQLVVPDSTPIIIPGQVEFTLTVLGYNFSENTVLIFGVGDTLQTEYVSSTELRAIPMITFDTDQGITAWTPPYPTTNGLDGGLSNTLYFFEGEVVVQAVSQTRMYGQANAPLDTIITINGTLLQDTTVTLADIGLATLQVQTPATTYSDVGTYIINVSRNFDETDPADLQFLRSYNYRFINGSITVEKMPLIITPEDLTVSYGENPDIILNYTFDPEHPPADPAALVDTARRYHDATLLTNALAVIEDFSEPQADGYILSEADLENLNFMTTFNALKNSTILKVENNLLVPQTDSASINSIYLLNVASKSLYDYITDSATAEFTNAVPGLTSKALLGASALVDGHAQVLTNGGLVPLLNGNLAPLLNGGLAPLLNGDFVTVLNGSLATVDASGNVTPIPNSPPVHMVNGGLVYLLNGNLVPLLNGGLVPLLNDAGSITLTESNSYVQLPNSIGTLHLTNGGLAQLLNGDEFPLINASDVQELNGSLVYLLNGNLVPLLNGSLVSFLNGGLATLLNGNLVPLLNASLASLLNASTVTFVNGNLVPLLNGDAINANSGGSNTAVIVDATDVNPLTNNYLGPMFGINGITGLSVGVHDIVPGVLNNPNFNPLFKLGKATITQATATYTAENKTRPYGESNPPLTYTVSGVAYGGGGIQGSPALSTTATATSPVGNYPITISQGDLSSADYQFNFVNGTLTVTDNPCLLTHSTFKNFGSTTTDPISLWLNMETKVSGQLVTDGDYLLFTGGTVTFNNIKSTPTITDFPVPNGKIVADHTVLAPVTSYDAATETWITRVPLGFSSTSDIFVTGAIINSSNGFVKKNGNTSSVLKGIFYSNKAFSDQWAYGIAAYLPQFTYGDVDAPGEVTSINGDYRAGTPTTQVMNLVNGGSGGGGNGYTGSSSSFDNFTACMPAASANSPDNLPSLQVKEVSKQPLSVGEIKLMPNPATDHILLSVVPKNTGNSRIIISAFDGRKMIEIDNGVARAGQQYVKKIDVSKLINGIYLLQVINGDAMTAKKIIISR